MQNSELLMRLQVGDNLHPQNPVHAAAHDHDAYNGHLHAGRDGEMGATEKHANLGHVCNSCTHFHHHIICPNDCDTLYQYIDDHKEHVSEEHAMPVPVLQYNTSSSQYGLLDYLHHIEQEGITKRMSSHEMHVAGQFDQHVYVHQAGSSYTQHNMRHGDAQLHHDDDDDDDEQHAAQKIDHNPGAIVDLNGDGHNTVCSDHIDVYVNAHEAVGTSKSSAQYSTRKRPYELVNGVEFCDESIYANMEDMIEEGGCLLDANHTATSLLRNQLSTSERSGRKELNACRLLSTLRSIVPKITKKDKASILVLDAISYVLELQKRIEDMQNDITSLQMDTSDNFAEEGCIGTIADSTKEDESSSHNFKIVELNVSSLGERTFHIAVRCEKGPGILLQLSRALEALNLNIINANLVSLGEHVVNTVVIKVNDDDPIMKPNDLKGKIVEHVHMFGLHL